MKKVTVSSNKFKFIADEELNPVKKKIKRKKAKNKGRILGFDIGKALEEVERNVKGTPLKRLDLKDPDLLKRAWLPKP